MLTLKQIVIRLFLSILLSGLIGIDRESTKKPAGLRTHVLVCVGSTLVMLLSIFIFEQYSYRSNIQPDRLGAQVISGIGFLGAGTIIREGSTIRGLTTAAGLWAVACIGLAVGAGFYTGSILATILVLVTLIFFSNLEKHINNKNYYLVLIVTSDNNPGQLGRIGKAIGDLGINISNIELEKENENVVNIRILVKMPNQNLKYKLINLIANQPGVIEVVEKN